MKTVSGFISLPSEKGAAGLTVKIFNQALAEDTLLGTVKTDWTGKYSYEYPMPPTEQHIFIRVFGPADAINPIAESPVRYRSDDETVIDIQIPAGKETGVSLFELIQQMLPQQIGTILPENLSDKQINLLASNTGFEAQDLRAYRQAILLNKTNVKIPAAVFFALALADFSMSNNAWKNYPLSEFSHALQEAQRNFIIPVISGASMKVVEADFRLQRISFFLETGLLSNNTSLKALLDLSSYTATVKNLVAALYADYGKDPVQFWTNLIKDKTLLPQAEKLKRSFAFHKLTLGNLPLVKLLLADASLTDLPSMAAWDVTVWKTKLVNPDIRTAIPLEITGATIEERVSVYASYLSGLCSFLYPTQAVSGRIQLDALLNKAQKLEFKTFFAANPNFKIEVHSADAYLHDNPQALAGNINQAVFRNELFSLSHRYALSAGTDRYASMSRLQSMQLNSSSAILKMGKRNFIEGYVSKSGTPDEGAQVFSNAEKMIQQTQLLKLNYGTDLQYLPYVIGNSVQNDANWNLLFGTEEFCSCSHCRSLYSPAAYLTDLLAFLDKRKLNPAGTALQVLERRRPDIANILLNCTNANTSVPYIDLVNEILENVIAGEPDFNYQTNASSEDLRVFPEHLNEKAYLKLSSAEYPWAMPFDLFTETGRTFLSHSGIRHDEILRIFRAEASDFEDSYVNSVLSITDTERKIITASGPAYNESKWWNYTFGPDNAIPVNVVLKQSGLRFTELQEILLTKFINPYGLIQIPAVCSLDGICFSMLHKDDRRKILQFVRLHRKLNMSIRQTDQFLMALNTGEINRNVLIAAAQLILLRRKVKIPVEELLTWFGRMATAHPDENLPGQYESIFLNKSVQQKWITSNPNSSSYPFEAFKLNANCEELERKVDATVSANFNYLTAVLSVNSDDLKQVFSFLKMNMSMLDLGSLSRVYSVFSMTKFLNCPVQEFGNLLILTGLDPILPSNTIRLLEFYETLKASNWTIAELNYLLRHQNAGQYNWTNEKCLTVLKDFGNAIRIASGEMDLRLLAVNQLAAQIGMPVTVIGLLLLPDENNKAYLNSKARPSIPLLDGMIRALKSSTIDSLALQEQSNLINDLKLLQKSAWTISKLGFTEIQLKKFISKDRTDLFDLDELTVLPLLSNIAGQFEKFNDLLNYRLLSGKMVLSEINLFDNVANQELVGAFESEKGEWNGIKQLLERRTDLISTLQRAKFVFETVTVRKTLGIQIEDFSDGGIFELCKPIFDANLSRKIEAIAKSKYSEKAWHIAATELRDRLRAQQRDALVSYLLDNQYHGNGTTDDMYAYYLIDVEMGACMQTSRIRLALSSVQLFVQRCLLGLEGEVGPDSIGNDKSEWEEWGWRKNYRVWEANRKIFLYPENWLEPEWREDKTPIFKELESELRQNELNSELAENVFLNYLKKLETVSNLEIMAICKSDAPVNPGEKVYYIFGKSYSSISEIYFRKYTERQSISNFGQWEKIDSNIESDHIIPIVKDGVLYICWPTFKEKSRKGKVSSVGGFGTVYGESSKYWQISISCIKYNAGEWTSKRTSKKYYEVSDSYTGFVTDWENLPEHTVFKADVIQGRINIKIGIPVLNFPSTIATAAFVIDHNIINVENIPVTYFNKLSNQRLPLTTYFENVDNGVLVNVLSKNASGDIAIADFNSDCFLISGNKVKLNSNLYLNLYAESANQGFSEIYSLKEEDLNRLLTETEAGYKLIDPYRMHEHLDPFSASEAYSQYNWEIFFHIPMLIATRLKQEERFEEARAWFHFVFNPLSTKTGTGSKRFWNFIPFINYTGINSVRELIESTETNQIYSEFINAVNVLEKNPFSPHTIARSRTVAYMKWVVMKYIDNLLEWADKLFREDTMESLNEATQLYMLAWNVLGRRPEELPEQVHEDKSFDQIRDELDPLSNVSADVIEHRVAAAFARTDARQRKSSQAESIMPSASGLVALPNLPAPTEQLGNTTIAEAELYILKSKYFCIPPNEKLLGYWDFLRDRFFKLRNCRNIDGEFRMLALYEPPIDPAMLIRAQQAGLTIAEALSAGSFTRRPHYRFAFMLQKAIDYANDVRTIGNALLTAIEKRDGEEITLLRSLHEQKMLDAVLLSRQLQINESKETIASIEFNLNMANKRREYYSNKEFMSSGETAQMVMMAFVNRMQLMSQAAHHTSAGLKSTPDVISGVAGLGGILASIIGGTNPGNASDSIAEGFNTMASILNITASEIGQMSSYERRYEDWMHQADLALDEIAQVEKQLIAAEIRTAIAEQELENHELQIEQSQEQFELLQSKFSNYDLYNWMLAQLKMLYYQSYSAAVEMALKAQLSLKFEMPEFKQTEFIKFGNWENMRQGLLCGEKLHHDLKRMEMAYINNNKRLLEISKTVSLAMFNADELIRLKREGVADFSIPKYLFDLDFPDYRSAGRRIKTASVTLPAIAGPFTGVNLILSADDNGISSSIATSTGQNDNGTFQFNFNDERYLPFEGLSIDCNWRIQMNGANRSFDFSTISDVLIHIYYTVDPAEHVVENTQEKVELTRHISIRNEFSDEWIGYKNSTAETFSVELKPEQFPYHTRNQFSNMLNNVNGWGRMGELFENNSEDYNFTRNGAVLTIKAKKSVEDLIVSVGYTVQLPQN